MRSLELIIVIEIKEKYGIEEKIGGDLKLQKVRMMVVCYVIIIYGGELG